MYVAYCNILLGLNQFIPYYVYFVGMIMKNECIQAGVLLNLIRLARLCIVLEYHSPKLP